MKLLFLSLLILCSSIIYCQKDDGNLRSHSFEKELQLLDKWNEMPDSFSTNYNLGAFYYNHGTKFIEQAFGNQKDSTATAYEPTDEELAEVMAYFTKAKKYFLKAQEIQPENIELESTMMGLNFMLGMESPRVERDPQAFRVIDGDTINKVDEIGMLQGEWERIYPDGSFRCRGTYVDDEKSGYWERKYDNGNWQYQVTFEKGFPHGYAKWYYKNGQIKSEGNFINGKQDGIHKTFYSNGNPMAEESFSSGKIDGFCKYYRENGKLSRQGDQLEDIRKGKWVFYDEDGKISTEVDYQER